MTRRKQPSRGFTLLEALLASVVLAVSVAAISQTIVAGQMQTVSALDDQRAISLAQTLMEEILSKPYWDPDGETNLGPEDDEFNRGYFDNCDDYDEFSEAAGQTTDIAGVSYGSGYAQFSREVSIKQVNQPIKNITNKAIGINVTVTVTDSNGDKHSIQRFIPEANF